MKDTPIQILDHIYYRDEASLETNKFRIASNDSQRMLDKNFSVCFSSSDERSLLIALNEKTYDDNKINKKNIYTFLRRRWRRVHNKNTRKNL